MTEKLIGLEKEWNRVVEPEDTAEVLGSGDLPVYGTPGLIAFMEYGAKELLAPHLNEEETSVGVGMEMRHLKATLVGATVQLLVRIHGVSGKKVVFRIEAYEKDQLLGDAVHERVIVNRKRFMEKLQNS